MVEKHALRPSSVSVKCEMHNLFAVALPVAVVVFCHDFVGDAVIRATFTPQGVEKHGDAVQIVSGCIHGVPMPVHVSVFPL